ncbi:MAG: pilus assembly protein [Devosiaceae bacterium]|nr:pilus assembly protein [Devosiaceae bacterium MH13]
MAQSLWSKLRRFSRNTKGTVVVTFAVALIPVSGLVGASMDYSRAANVRSELQNALDASVLAVAHQRDLTDAQAREQLVYRVEALLAGAQGSSNLMIYVDQSVDDTLLAATATIDMKTSLLQVMGISHITVGAEASVSAE